MRRDARCWNAVRRAEPAFRPPHRSGLRWAALVALLVPLVAAGRGSDGDPLATRPERSEYTETSRLSDVERFLGELASRSDLLRVQTFGRSEEGRPLLLATLSDPPVSEPREAFALGRPVVLLQGNIHGGEVEGKEASQELMRRLAVGDLRSLLTEVVVLLVPVYNVDGNEAIDLGNRTEQYGPIAGVGRRENAKGLDLNRDYMKLEAAETRAFVELLNAWDPHVVVDLHTTNGSYHGYHLTYSIPVNLSFEPELLAFERETLMPALAKAMAERHGFRTYYYGNFDERAPRPGVEGKKAWVAFDHRPRIGQNYVGLRNRIAILSEAYSYLSFRDRIAVTAAFVEEILRYAAGHAGEIRSLTQRLDQAVLDAGRRGEPTPLGVDYEPKALPAPVPILVGKVTHEVNPRNGKEMTVVVKDEVTPVEMPDYGFFAPSRSVPTAFAYVLPASEATTPAVVELLRRHGILVEQLTAPLATDVAWFEVSESKAANRPFQGHATREIAGTTVTEQATLPAGTIVVRRGQPLGRLAAYLLEPESDDGVVVWNLLDPAIAVGKRLPIGKVMRAVGLPTARTGG